VVRDEAILLSKALYFFSNFPSSSGSTHTRLRLEDSKNGKGCKSVWEESERKNFLEARVLTLISSYVYLDESRQIS